MSRFDYFVVFAEMRTGSNFLEANINLLDGIHCLGEVFNPSFIGYPKQADVLGITQQMREADPMSLITRIKDADGLNGFRFFNDHDPRVLDAILDDPRCAKIILTRNPVESFVSWKIAAATGQWKLTNVNHVKTETVRVEIPEFENHLEALQGFQVRLLNGLQRTGQTAFYVAYEDLQDVAVTNGLSMFLGSDVQIKSLDKKLKKQNPAPMSSKVENFEEVEQALARMDRFDLNRTPNFEPRRGPMIPTYVAAPQSPLLFMPLRSGPNKAIRRWLAALDRAKLGELKEKFTQKTLRDWKRLNGGHRSFTVLRHPVARAHTAFCERILSTGEGSFTEIRATLRKVHKIPLPDNEASADYRGEQHREAFLAFLRFLKGNLNAQTAVRVDGAWASQFTLLQGMAEFSLPDMILREDDMRNQLALLVSQIGLTQMPKIPAETDPLAGRLSAIYDAEIEQAARDAYVRDYDSFGFVDWKP